MKTIATKRASAELRRQLINFAVAEAARSKLHQTWVDEALAGSFKPGSAVRLEQIAAKARAVVA